MMKSKLIKSIISVTIIGLLFITVSFAWFVTMNKNTEEIIITTGDLKLEIISFERANFSSIKDNITEDNYKNESIWIKASSLANFNTSVCVPGESYLFKIVVKNIGDISGYLSVDFTNMIATGGLTNAFKSKGYFGDNVLNLLNNTDEEIDKTLDLMDSNNIVDNKFNLLKNEVLSINKEESLYFVIYFDENTTSYFENDSFNIGKIILNLNQKAI